MGGSSEPAWVLVAEIRKAKRAPKIAASAGRDDSDRVSIVLKSIHLKKYTCGSMKFAEQKCRRRGRSPRLANDNHFRLKSDRRLCYLARDWVFQLPNALKF